MLVENQRPAIETLVEKHGLSAVSNLVLNSAHARIDLIPEEEEDYAVVGNSRFGGDPDVPLNSPWLDEIADKVFLFQARLSDFPWASSLGLPKVGWLYVFSEQEPDSTSTYYSGEAVELVRHRMVPPEPDYIFSDLKAFKLRGSLGIDFPEYGSEEFDQIEAAGLEEEYELLMTSGAPEEETFCELAGRFEELNGDLREEAARSMGGQPFDWRSLWRVKSSFKSGLVINDFHVLHGLVRSVDLRARDFSSVYSQTEVV